MHTVFIAQKNRAFLDDIIRLPVWANQCDFHIADTATDGHTAINLLVKNHYDLVILDIHLPGIDGLTLLKYFKEGASYMLFVLTSQEPEHTYTRQSLQLGAFDYLLLPINNEIIEELLFRVDNILHYSANIDVVSAQWANTISNTPNIYTLIAKHNPTIATIFQNYINYYASSATFTIKSTDTQILSVFNSTIQWFYKKLPYLNTFLNIQKSSTFHSLLNHYELETNVHYCTNQLSALTEFILILHPYTNDSTLDKIFDYILANIDYDISQKTISKNFYQTNAAFSKIFLEKTKVHFNDYISLVKLLRGEYLLLNSNLLVYEIGNKIGYTDYNYFAKVFKQKYGLTPTEFRRSFL